MNRIEKNKLKKKSKVYNWICVISMLIAITMFFGIFQVSNFEVFENSTVRIIYVGIFGDCLILGLFFNTRSQSIDKLFKTHRNNINNWRERQAFQVLVRLIDAQKFDEARDLLNNTTLSIHLRSHIMVYYYTTQKYSDDPKTSENGVKHLEDMRLTPLPEDIVFN